jgi:hypothetical protein
MPPIFRQGWIAGNDYNLTANTAKVARKIPTQEPCASRYYDSARRFHAALVISVPFLFPSAARKRNYE